MDVPSRVTIVHYLINADMKFNITFSIIVAAAVMAGCGGSNPTPSIPSSACVLMSASKSGGGGFLTDYQYGSDGRLIAIRYKPSSGTKDSAAVADMSIVHYYTGTLGLPAYSATTYTGDDPGRDMSLFIGSPQESHSGFNDGKDTFTDVRTFYFGYDGKGRINEVKEETPNVVGDYEYDLFISYDANDNVSQLQLKYTTGPNQTLTMTPAGYDDKVNPFSDTKGGRFIFSNWDYAQTLFTSLSKHNCLGYQVGDTKITTTYTYNEQNYPLVQTDVNYNSYSGQTGTTNITYQYVCK